MNDSVLGNADSVFIRFDCTGALSCQISLPVRLGGLGVHLMSYEDGAACDAAYLAAAALTHLSLIHI